MRELFASLLLVASWDIPLPEFHRHTAARRDLVRAMRADQTRNSYFERNSSYLT